MKVTWKSPCGNIEKEILAQGIFSKKPIERFACSVKIDDVNFSGFDESTEGVNRGKYLKQSSIEMVITIGDGNAKVDEYVERAVQTMFIGERSLVRITLPHFGDSSGQSIGVDFKITLIAYEEHKPIWEWTPKEKYNVALNYKESGVALHKSMRIVEAFMKFTKACKVLITMEPIDDVEIEEMLRKDIDNLRKVLYNNMAECHLIRNNYEHAISLCDKVLRRDENNVKALYRRAVANENLKDYESALECMEKVVILEPKNSAANDRLVVYKKKVCQAKKSYDDIVKKMFR